MSEEPLNQEATEPSKPETSVGPPEKASEAQAAPTVDGGVVPETSPTPPETVVVADSAPVTDGQGSDEPATTDKAVDAKQADTTTHDADPNNAEAASRVETRPKKKAVNPSLMRAYRTGRPVQGSVVGVVKGGYEIRIGKTRGFCPHSQIARHREDNPESQVGQSYQFRVTQVRRGGDDVVVSRRAVLVDEMAEEAKAVRATLIEGGVMQGRVAGTADFGAFIDLGAGVMGLSHISELAHRRVKRVEDAVKVGETVQVRVLKVHEGTDRISLSIRQATDDPWTLVADRFQVGQVHPGIVRRVADFGAFVEVAPEVEALAPASEFPPSPGGWKEGLEPGTELQWHVLSVDPKERRISVTPPGSPAEQGPVEPGAVLKGTIQRLERYGVFVWLGPGRVGLLPRAWAGVSGDADLERSFKIGDEIEVSVQELSEDGRRIRLAKKGVEVRREREAPAPRERERPRADRQRAARPEEPTSTFGTSLADKLRSALGKTDSRGSSGS